MKIRHNSLLVKQTSHTCKRKLERTGVIQMLPKLHVSVTPSRDVEVSLHLVSFQTSVNPTSLQSIPPKPTRSSLELPLLLLPPDLSNNMLRVCVLFLFPLPSQISTLKGVHPLVVHPLIPIRAIPRQRVPGKYSIARCVLHVDVQIATPHGYHNVYVDL